MLLLVCLGLCHPGGGCKDTAHPWEHRFLTRPQRKREILFLPVYSNPTVHASSLNDGNIQIPCLVGTLQRLIGFLMLARVFVKSSIKGVLKPRGHRGQKRGP